MFKRILFLTLIVSSLVHAESVSFKIEPVKGEIHSYDILPEQAQVVLRCQFIKDGVPTPYSEKRPMTRLEIVERNGSHIVTKISVKGDKVFDFLPGFKLHNCSFNLMVIGRNLRNQKLTLGDFIQFGQLQGQMTKEELAAITNPSKLTEAIRQSWNPLVLRLEEGQEHPQIVIE